MSPTWLRITFSLLAFEGTHPPELFLTALSASACSFHRLSFHHCLPTPLSCYFVPHSPIYFAVDVNLFSVNTSYSFLCFYWFFLGSFPRLYVNQNFYLWLILQVTCLAYSLIMKMEVARSSKTSLKYRTARCHIPYPIFVP